VLNVIMWVVRNGACMLGVWHIDTGAKDSVTTHKYNYVIGLRA